MVFKPICIDPLSTCCCTSRCEQFILSACSTHWTSQGRVEPEEKGRAEEQSRTESWRTGQVKIILAQVVLEVTRNTVGGCRSSGDGYSDPGARSLGVVVDRVPRSAGLQFPTSHNHSSSTLLFTLTSLT
jgi:hypothetical protein